MGVVFFVNILTEPLVATLFRLLNEMEGIELLTTEHITYIHVLASFT